MRVTSSSLLVLSLSTKSSVSLVRSPAASRLNAQKTAAACSRRTQSMTTAAAAAATTTTSSRCPTVDVYPYGTTEFEHSYQDTKIVHFCRHAEGTHNVQPTDYSSMAQIDARLTRRGKEQCQALSDSIIAAASTDNNDTTNNKRDLRESAQLVVTSPLTRCIQTSLLSFGATTALHKKNGNNKGKDVVVPFLAHCALRETVNYNADKRRPIDEIAADFYDSSSIQFTTHVATNHDDLWQSYQDRLGCHETYKRHRESGELYKVADRARTFFQWLAARSERHVVVCTHAAYLRCLFNFGQTGGVPMQPPQHLDDRDVKVVDVPVVRYCGGDAAFQESFRTSFENCELRSVVIGFPQQQRASSNDNDE